MIYETFSRSVGVAWLAITLYILPARAAASFTSTTSTSSTSTDDDWLYTSMSTIYVASVTYTAPASCPTPFTVETVKTIYAYGTTPTFSPTSTTTGYFYATAYLPPAAATAATTDYFYSNYVAHCSRSDGWSTGSDNNPGATSYDDDNFDVCYRGFACMSWRKWVIFVATVLPALFVLGFLESFLWFRQLMRGRGALRFGTVCWILLSVWVACFTRRSPPRPKEDRKALEEQWKAMSAGAKFKLWWKWGFRHAYPVTLLGPDPRHPARATTASHGADANPVSEAK